MFIQYLICKIIMTKKFIMDETGQINHIWKKWNDYAGQITNIALILRSGATCPGSRRLSLRSPHAQTKRYTMKKLILTKSIKMYFKIIAKIQGEQVWPNLAKSPTCGKITKII